MNVIEIEGPTYLDIPKGLRQLADFIEEGRYGEVVNVAWVMDADYRPLEIGLLGSGKGAPDAVTVLLMEAGKQNLIGRMGK